MGADLSDSVLFNHYNLKEWLMFFALSQKPNSKHEISSKLKVKNLIISTSSF